MKRLLSIALFAAVVGNATAGEPPPPAPPGTDIWIAELASGDTLRAAAARNLTARAGHDNQPAFSGSQAFLFTSDANGQTDAWRYGIANGKVEPVLVTPESEYSPTPVPGGGMSVVRVALDGVQQLWWLPPGGDDYELLFPLIEGVGYHDWLDAERVALFLVREPAELHVANRRTGEVLKLAKNVGRSLHAVPGEQGVLAFIEPGEDGTPWIKHYDTAAKTITAIAPVIDGSQDFAFLPDGRMLMASGRSVNAWNGEAWQAIAQFDSLPGEITRLAVTPDGTQLAFVVNEGN